MAWSSSNSENAQMIAIIALVIVDFIAMVVGLYAYCKKRLE